MDVIIEVNGLTAAGAGNACAAVGGCSAVEMGRSPGNFAHRCRSPDAFFVNTGEGKRTANTPLSWIVTTGLLDAAMGVAQSSSSSRKDKLPLPSTSEHLKRRECAPMQRIRVSGGV